MKTNSVVISGSIDSSELNMNIIEAFKFVDDLLFTLKRAGFRVIRHSKLLWEAESSTENTKSILKKDFEFIIFWCIIIFDTLTL